MDEEDQLGEYMKSKQFQEAFRKKVEEDTWGRGFPMYYMDKQGWLVEHWEDGTINLIKQLRT